MKKTGGPRELVTRSEKQSHFDWIRSAALKRWPKAHSVGRNNDDCYALGKTDLARDCLLRIWGGGFFGFALEGVQGKDFVPIIFNFHCSTEEADGRGTAARLYFDGTSTFLVHDGRTANLPRPRGNETVNVDRRTYFIVAEIGSDTFFEDVIHYNDSRKVFEEFSKCLIQKPMHYGPDYGARGKFSRQGSDANPLHAFIVESLEQKLLKLGFKPACHPHRGPDLLMQRAGKKVLIEVKPGNGFNELTTALGQLAVYGAENNPDLKICVCARGGWPHQRLEKSFEQHAIEVVEFDLSSTNALKIDFPTLEQQLSNHKL